MNRYNEQIQVYINTKVYGNDNDWRDFDIKKEEYFNSNNNYHNFMGPNNLNDLTNILNILDKPKFYNNPNELNLSDKNLIFI